MKKPNEKQGGASLQEPWGPGGGREFPPLCWRPLALSHRRDVAGRGVSCHREAGAQLVEWFEDRKIIEFGKGLAPLSQAIKRSDKSNLRE